MERSISCAFGLQLIFNRGICVEQVRKAFKAVDLDGSGSLDKDEVNKVAKPPLVILYTLIPGVLSYKSKAKSQNYVIHTPYPRFEFLPQADCVISSFFRLSRASGCSWRKRSWKNSLTSTTPTATALMRWDEARAKIVLSFATSPLLFAPHPHRHVCLHRSCYVLWTRWRSIHAWPPFSS